MKRGDFFHCFFFVASLYFLQEFVETDAEKKAASSGGKAKSNKAKGAGKQSSSMDVRGGNR